MFCWAAFASYVLWIVRYPMVFLRTVCSAFSLLLFFPDNLRAEDSHFDKDLLQNGMQLYTSNCMVCHGTSGEGDGPLAHSMVPRPSNFTLGVFKFRTTGPFNPPARTDLLDTIENGVASHAGHLMPSFAHLNPEEKQALVEVVRVFAGLDQFGTEIELPQIARTPDKQRGAELYRALQCADCHGTNGEGDGTVAQDLRDDNDLPIKPTNLTVGKFKGGDTPKDIWMRIYTGIDGTPMPSFGRNLDHNELWDLVAYVMSLSGKEGSW